MKCFFFFRSESLPVWCLCPGLQNRGVEGGSGDERKALTFSGLFARGTNVPLCGHFDLSLLSYHFLHLFLLSFSTLSTPLCLSLSVLLSHWDGSHVLWRPSEMKPHAGAVAGGRRRRGRLQKKLCRRSQPRHQPETKLDVVKLSNYLRKLQQNLRRRKTERERRVFSLCCKTSRAKWYLYNNLWFRKLSVGRHGCWRTYFFELIWIRIRITFSIQVALQNISLKCIHEMHLLI